MAGDQVQRWELVASGLHHRVAVTGSFVRTVTWHVDGRLVAAKRSSDDTVRLRPGDRLPTSGPPAGPDAEEPPDVGALAVAFSSLGRPKRATWYRADGDVPATARALLGTGGIDLEPEPGSPAARREERIRRHPRRHTALAVAGGAAAVAVPLLLGLLVVRLTIAVPWPDWDLPSIPWPDWDLPAIPWPDVDLPDWQLPDWVRRLLDKAQYVWPVVLAWVLARREVRRRRAQEALRAELKAEQTTGQRTAQRAGTSRPADGDPDPPSPGGTPERTV